jgi:hypothetical protein
MSISLSVRSAAIIAVPPARTARDDTVRSPFWAVRLLRATRENRRECRTTASVAATGHSGVLADFERAVHG